MNIQELKKMNSELLRDTGHLVTGQPDNRIILLLVRAQVLLSLLLDEVEREQR